MDWTIAGSVRYWVTRKENEPCLISNGATYTWSDVFDRSCRIGQGLIQADLQPQDRVIYLGKNNAEFFEILVGASMAGAVTAAVNWRLVPRELLYIINHSRARVLFVETHFLPQLEQIRSQFAHVEQVIVIGGTGPDAFDRWLLRQIPKDPEVPMRATDTAFQMYTSGTTGHPKGAMFSNAAVRATSPMAEMIGAGEDSVILVAMPVFHASGSSLGVLALTVGATSVIAREAAPDHLLQLIERHRVTMSTFVPVVLKTLLECPEVRTRDLSSLDTIAYAASPISPELLRACLARFGCKFIQIYGMTETNGVTALSPEDHLNDLHPERLLSGGRALPGVSLRVVDPMTGEDVDDGVFGEVWIKSPTNMTGYWDSPEETSAGVTPDGYVRSGDGGYLQEGYLYLKDRIKDMIISGAENVYPIEVENILVSHPGIDDVAVIGVPSVKWGETVKAIVVRKSLAHDLSAADVIAYAKANLAGYKCPTSVDFVDELPRNASGKVLKRVLREQHTT